MILGALNAILEKVQIIFMLGMSLLFFAVVVLLPAYLVIHFIVKFW
jgi:hypothetical protein